MRSIMGLSGRLNISSGLCYAALFSAYHFCVEGEGRPVGTRQGGSEDCGLLFAWHRRLLLHIDIHSREASLERFSPLDFIDVERKIWLLISCCSCC